MITDDIPNDKPKAKKPYNRTKKKAIRLTDKVKDFIIDKMCDGLDIATICRKYPNDVPDAKVIYRASAKNDDFSKRITEAHGVRLMGILDEYTYLMSKTATELYPQMEDWRQANAERTAKVKSLEFILNKIAPMLSTRFKNIQEINITGDVKNEISVIKYYSPMPITLINEESSTGHTATVTLIAKD